MPGDPYPPTSSQRPPEHLFDESNQAGPSSGLNSNFTPPLPKKIYPTYSWRSALPTPRLVYIRDEFLADQEISELPPGPLGFDLEWKPVFMKGQKENKVALVQLAHASVILLIQLTAIRIVPQRLRELLLNPNVLKAGVNIKSDAAKLWTDWGVDMRGCVELSYLARSADNGHWKGKYVQQLGLARLCETYFEHTLAKGKTQRSNWEAKLTPIQQDYAANDCHSGLALYNTLSELLRQVTPPAEPGYYSFDMVGGTTFEPIRADRVSGIIWRPRNPNYDPGPEPIREPKEKKSNKSGDQADDTSTLSSGSTFEISSATTSISGMLSPRRDFPRIHDAAAASPSGDVNANSRNKARRSNPTKQRAVGSPPYTGPRTPRHQRGRSEQPSANSNVTPGGQMQGSSLAQ